MLILKPSLNTGILFTVYEESPDYILAERYYHINLVTNAPSYKWLWHFRLYMWPFNSSGIVTKAVMIVIGKLYHTVYTITLKNDPNYYPTLKALKGRVRRSELTFFLYIFTTRMVTEATKFVLYSQIEFVIRHHVMPVNVN